MRIAGINLVLILLLLIQLSSIAIAARLGSPFLIAELLMFTIGIGVIAGLKIAAVRR